MAILCVICPLVVPDVTGLRVTGVTIDSISLAWDVRMLYTARFSQVQHHNMNPSGTK